MVGVWDHQFEYDFAEETRNFLLAGLAKSLVLKNWFCFYQEICFSFFTKGACKF